ncbi:MAG: DUF2294 domain-containing protein [Phycisphaerales bacterium]
MKTNGQIEAAVSAGIVQFEQEYLGRGPGDVRTYLLDDLLVVRLKSVLTAAEERLVQTMPAERGRDLLKQVRTQLIELARLRLETLIKDICETAVVSLHHDISTTTGEEIILFTLDNAPAVRNR